MKKFALAVTTIGMLATASVSANAAMSDRDRSVSVFMNHTMMMIKHEKAMIKELEAMLTNYEATLKRMEADMQSHGGNH